MLLCAADVDLFGLFIKTLVTNHLVFFSHRDLTSAQNAVDLQYMKNSLFEDPNEVVENLFGVNADQIKKAAKRTFWVGVTMAIVYGIFLIAFFGTLFYVIGHFIAKWW